MWEGLLYTLIDSQKHNVFFILPSSFRRELPLWYSVRLTLVSTTIVLTQTLYNLFGKLLFSHFHTESHTGNSFKNLILQYTNKKPYKSSPFFTFLRFFLCVKPSFCVIKAGWKAFFLICIHSIKSYLYNTIFFIIKYSIIWCLHHFTPLNTTTSHSIVCYWTFSLVKSTPSKSW